MLTTPVLSGGGILGALIQTIDLRSTGGAVRTTQRSTGVAGEDGELCIALLEENERLQRQVGEMKMFFEDHGLAWVGTGDFFDTGYRLQQHPGGIIRRMITCSVLNFFHGRVQEYIVIGSTVIVEVTVG